MSIKIEVHSIDSNGTCSLSEKSGEVLVLTFGDGTITEAPLSVKSLIQLLRMKLGQKPKLAIPAVKPEPRPEVKQEMKQAVPAVLAVPVGNGPPVK